MPITLNGTTGIVGPDGSAASPAIQGSDANTGVFFPAADTVAIATGGTERLRADSSGNVGIGTSSPAQRLHVFSSVAEVATLESNFNSSDNVQLRFKGISGERWAIGNNVSTGGTGVNFDFYDLAANANRARIDSSGQWLLGCTGLTGDAPNTAGGTVKQTNGNTKVRVTGDGSPAFQFYSPSGGTGSPVGSIFPNASSTTYSTSSDYRLKENVQPMTGALEKVALLKPCTYTWKSTGEASQGFIAHELQAVVSECVVGEKDAVNDDGSINPQGIDTSFLVATLTAAIQELKAEVDALKAQLGAQP